MVGLTKRSYDIPTLKNLSATANFPFALLNGEALAQELRIHTYPVVVFVATTSKQTYRIEGTPSVEQIEQVVRLMKGSR
jgi:predicted DsbA family dithiol-disulfide isomerase